MNNNHCLKGIESPRIYTYKITFKGTPYYYYGVHKEKRFNEDYLGSPTTNKWYWDLYEVEKQILEVFPNTDEGWIDALNVEKRLIKPVFNNDPYCMNESCGGYVSLEVRRRNGKDNYAKGIGIHGLSKDQKREISKKTYSEGKGLASISKDQRREINEKVNKQQWKCLITGKISNPSGLSRYQRKRGIDTSKRVRIA